MRRTDHEDDTESIRTVVFGRTSYVGLSIRSWLRCDPRRMLRLNAVRAAGILSVLVACGPALALDPGANPVLKSPSSPRDVFSMGFAAYKRGETAAAIDALQHAAKLGMPARAGSSARCTPPATA